MHLYFLSDFQTFHLLCNAAVVRSSIPPLYLFAVGINWIIVPQENERIHFLGPSMLDMRGAIASNKLSMNCSQIFAQNVFDTCHLLQTSSSFIVAISKIFELQANIYETVTTNHLLLIYSLVQYHTASIYYARQSVDTFHIMYWKPLELEFQFPNATFHCQKTSREILR